jgi:hypothetical protein
VEPRCGAGVRPGRDGVGRSLALSDIGDGIAGPSRSDRDTSARSQETRRVTGEERVLSSELALFLAEYMYFFFNFREFVQKKKRREMRPAPRNTYSQSTRKITRDGWVREVMRF